MPKPLFPRIAATPSLETSAPIDMSYDWGWLRRIDRVLQQHRQRGIIPSCHRSRPLCQAGQSKRALTNQPSIPVSCSWHHRGGHSSHSRQTGSLRDRACCSGLDFAGTRHQAGFGGSIITRPTWHKSRNCKRSRSRSQTDMIEVQTSQFLI